MVMNTRASCSNQLYWRPLISGGRGHQHCSICLGMNHPSASIALVRRSPRGDARCWLMCAGVAVAGSCGNDEFLCPEGWCAPLTLRCDGVRDCAGGEDEKLCGECARMRTRACHCYASTLAVRMGKAGADSDCLSESCILGYVLGFL